MPKEIDLKVLLRQLKEKGVQTQEVEAYLESLISSNVLKLPPKDR